MLEFYTDEFKENAIEELNIIKDKFYNLLPDLYKWQMRGCVFRNNDISAYYTPINSDDKKQIGTRIVLINDTHNYDLYTITSLPNSLKLKIKTINGVTKIYYVFYKDHIKTFESIFMYNNHYVISIWNMLGKIKQYNNYSNVNDKDFINNVSLIEKIDNLDEIEKLYFNIDKEKVRKK